MADIKQIQVDGTTMDISVPNGKLDKAQMSAAFQNILDEGYKFMGVAHPDDPSVSPVSHVFYLADSKGTYTNKGGISVTEDTIVFITFDSSWHKVVTSIASNAKVTELASKVDSFNEFSESPFTEVLVDADRKILSQRDINGNSTHHTLHDFNNGLSVSGEVLHMDSSDGPYVEICIDRNKKLISYIKKDGTVGFPNGIESPISIVPEKKWKGKKWVCLGDSLTALNTATTLHYFDYIAEETGIETVNLGVGGTGYAKDNTNGNAFYQRISTIPDSFDVLTIFGSFNDLSFNPGDGWGTASDHNTTTRLGCVNTTLDNLFARFPLANVGIILPTPWSNHYPSMPVPEGVSSNNHDKYVNGIIEICRLRGIPYLDLFHESALRPWEEEYRLLCYSKDRDSLDANPVGVHPDERGHKIISTKINDFLNKLL